MSFKGGNQERRRFLKQGAVFGLAAAGLSSAGWASPSMVSFQPPAALGGSERLFFNGSDEMVIARKDVHEPGRFTLTGVELFGRWKLHIVPPPQAIRGVDLVVSMRPETVEFDGGESEVHDVFVNWMATGEVDHVETSLVWHIEAAPEDKDSSPITAVHACTLKLSF